MTLGALLGLWLWHERAQRLVLETQRLESQAHVVEENLVRQLQGANNALAGMRYDLIGADHDTDMTLFPLRLKVLADAMPGVRGLLVLDSQGRVTASSRREIVGRDYSSRIYYQTPRARPDDTTLYVSPPFQSRLGPVVINLSRTMTGSDGRFAGVVSANLDPTYFEILLRSVLYAPDMRAFLVHGEGRALLTSPPQQPDLAGADVGAPGSPFARYRAAGGVADTLEDFSGSVPQLITLRRIQPPTLAMDHPLVIGISRPLAAIHAVWLAELRVGLALYLTVALGLAAGLHLWQRRRQTAAAVAAAVEAARRESTRRLELGLQGADLGLWEWDMRADTMRVNDREWQILGVRPGEIDLQPTSWRARIHPEDWPTIESAFAAHVAGQAPAYKVEHRLRHRDGHWVWVLGHAVVMARDAQGKPTHMLGTHLDITDRKRAEAMLRDTAERLESANAQLSALTLTDGLTGVGNRRLFDQTLQGEWLRAARQAQPLALLMIDIDHFKRYNDARGHLGGDECLRRVADVLTACVRRPGELLARYGGEEFAILLLDSDADGAAAVARRCTEAVAAADIAHPDSPLGPRVTLSIGLASRVPGPDTPPDSLVAAADAALYEAKRAGRNRVAGIAPMQEEAPEKKKALSR